MATPVLPYPDMDFTPLDILTAAEMDQMVANDQYLRDFCAGLADGTNLSDGVIQARKLVPGISNYSTSEQNTGFRWKDGKTIYKKTIDFGALPNTTNKAANLNISNLGTIIDSEAFCIYPNGINFPLPFTNTNDFASSVMLNFTATQVVITTGSDRSGATGYVTIYYTKTN